MKKRKTCTYGGCQSPLYARGFCLYHYRSIYLAGKMRDKPKKKYSIPKISPKTKERNEKYRKKRLDFIESQKDKQGRLFCIFCGKRIYGDPSLHHGLGRDDDIMLDEQFWFVSHNYCHVHQYHSMSWKDIPWWEEYMERLIDWCNTADQTLVLDKEKNRMNKNQRNDT